MKADTPSILIVDDDKYVRETLASLLELEGYASSSTSGGQEALALLRGGAPRPALVLLDWHMPKMSGQQFLADRLQSQELLQIPVIVLTASSRDSLSINLEALQIAAVLVKPFGSTELLEVIEQALAGANALAE